LQASINTQSFIGIAFVVTVYSVYDMVKFNRQRRIEFAEAQSKMEADSLSAARIAFINGTATDEQIQMVEEATKTATQTGIRLPPLLSPPSAPVSVASVSTPTPTTSTSETQATAQGGVAGWSFSKKTNTSTTQASTPESIQDKAKAAFEREKENQRKGGMLDRVGIDAGEGKNMAAPVKRGWFW
jgi:hypothetical protein